MSQKVEFIPGIGEILLVKRRGSKNIRLSVGVDGRVRVSMPFWSPYQVGINFAKSRKEWLNQNIAKTSGPLIAHGDRIGKSHTLVFTRDDSLRSISSRVSGTTLKVSAPYELSAPNVQKKVRTAAEKVLKQQAGVLLPQKLKWLAAQHGFEYKEVKVRKMTSRWGSCSSHGTITLSYYLIQLPWDLIDYVLVHELVHTQHMNHGKGFWSTFERVMPKARQLRKQMHGFRPALLINP